MLNSSSPKGSTTKEDWLMWLSSVVMNRKLLSWIREAAKERSCSDPIFSLKQLSLCEILRTLDLANFIEVDETSSPHPKDHEYWHSYGLSLRDKKQVKEAIDAFRCAVNLNQACAESWFYLAVSCDNIGKESRAIPSYLKALDLGLAPKKRVNALLFLSSSLTKVNHTQDAVPFVNQIDLSALETDFQLNLHKKLSTAIRSSQQEKPSCCS